MASELIWAPIAAALGASALTAAVAIRIERHRAGSAAQAVLQESKAAAYASLIAHAGLVAHTAHALHEAMRLRSGLSEGIDVALRTRKPLDPLEIHDQLRRDLEPLYAAWALVWSYGSAEGVHTANDVIDGCAAVMGAATQRGSARGAVLRALAGEKWNPDQLHEWAKNLGELAEARKQLTVIARREIGTDIPEVFSGD